MPTLSQEASVYLSPEATRVLEAARKAAIEEVLARHRAEDRLTAVASTLLILLTVTLPTLLKGLS